MKSSDAWAMARTNQNIMVKVANLPVIARFGTRTSALQKPNKSKKDNQFVVGETEVGGEEQI